MSGGVDSSVAAALLKKQGFEVIGIFMDFGTTLNDQHTTYKLENRCCSIEQQEDARKVAKRLDISLYTVNFKEVFKTKIIQYFLDEYKIGRTPNPCVMCNKVIKFDLLLKKAFDLGCKYLATGHYIRKSKVKNSKSKVRYKLFRAKDKEKDQSYFLYNLTQEQLKHLLFPIGDYIKIEVRKLARKFGLPVFKKRESQEICFIPGKSHYEFLKCHLKNFKKGPIKTLDGKKVGIHEGLSLYTIGQRKNIKIGGIGPFYVIKADFNTNILYVTDDSQDKNLYSDKFLIKDVNWIPDIKPKLPLKTEVKTRYRHPSIKAILEEKNRQILVKLGSPQRAVTPGQSAVFYENDELLGGGIIDKTVNARHR